MAFSFPSFTISSFFMSMNEMNKLNQNKMEHICRLKVSFWYRWHFSGKKGNSGFTYIYKFSLVFFLLNKASKSFPWMWSDIVFSYDCVWKWNNTRKCQIGDSRATSAVNFFCPLGVINKPMFIGKIFLYFRKIEMS